MSCPSHDAFQRLLDGGMADVERAEFQLHVDGCDQCEHELLRLVQAFGDTLDSAARANRQLQSGLVDRAMGLSRTRASANLLPASVGLEPGDRVEHFEITSRLGRGGMGEVFLARDVRLKRQVALKVTAAATTPEIMDRFRREAQAMAQFSHPHIVNIYDVGEIAGTPFVAMEFVRGQTLRERMVDPLSLTEILDVAVPIAGALAEAHRRGVVHRDLKPANVMIGEDGRVRVLDFGLAAFLGPTVDEATHGGTTAPASRVALTGAAGTPRYMAPEQWVGAPVSGTTDVWAMGTMLFELAAGRAPFEAETSKALLELHLAETPAPPLRDYANVPPELDAIVNRCLRRDRKERPSAKELEEALRQVPARSPAKRRWRRVGSAAVFLLVGGGAAAAWYGTRDDPPVVAPPPTAVVTASAPPTVSPPPEPSAELAVGDRVVTHSYREVFEEKTVTSIGARRVQVAALDGSSTDEVDREHVMKPPPLHGASLAKPGDVVIGHTMTHAVTKTYWYAAEVITVEDGVVRVSFLYDGAVRNLAPSMVVVPPAPIARDLKQNEGSLGTSPSPGF